MRPLHDEPELRDYARLAFEAGLAVTRPNGERIPIGISATPVVLPKAEIVRRAAHVAALTSATLRTARWRMSDRAEAARVYAELSPAESRLVRATAAQLDRLAVARVDYLPGDVLRALEVNATIPAMQGYSDIAVEAWLASRGVHDIAAWRDRNGSNAAALLDALRAQFDALRPGSRLGLLALVCRRGDAQITELDYLARRFGQLGIDARIVHPDELRREDDTLFVGRDRIDLAYRHLFVHRLDREPSPVFESALRDFRSGTIVLNPPAPQVEMKSTLAVLSSALEDGALADRIGLTEDEREAVRASVPWTRDFRPGPARLPDGERVADLAEAIAAEPERYVLKRAWSYGGHDVFVGRAHASEEFAKRVDHAYPGVRGWRALVERAASDARGYVVQATVEVKRESHVLCLPDRVQRIDATVDYSAYASVFAEAERAPIAWSGVCRAAASDVVNIVGGGAVVPLITREVFDAIANIPKPCVDPP